MISVITPVYNGERFIESCIKNVIDQASDAEHVIVDGSSTDKTVEIIKRYAEKHPHISWISEKDQGQSDAMNKGIAMAKGDIITFLNVDDFYEKGTLNFVSKLFPHLPIPSFLSGNCNVLGENDRLRFVNKPSKLKLKDLMIPNPMPMNPSAYFYHKEIHEKAGLYDINDHYAMDADFIYRAVTCANLKYVNINFGNCRLIEGTKTFKNIKDGGYRDLNGHMLRKHRKNLSFIERIKLPFRQFYFHNLAYTVFNFKRNKKSNRYKQVIKDLFNFCPYHLRYEADRFDK